MALDDEALAARQQALVKALSQAGASSDGLAGLPGARVGVQRGLQAYRVNAQALSAKALASVFPQLLEALGDDDFEAMAWALWRRFPPEQGDLALWGASLVGFLQAQEGMEPELCDLARLEWAMHEAERARDADLDVASLELLTSHEPAQVGLRMRPGVALLQQRCAGPQLVWRKGWRSCHATMNDGDAALMQALLEGRDLAAALGAASQADAAFDFSAWLQAALRETWLQGAIVVDNKIS